MLAEGSSISFCAVIISSFGWTFLIRLLVCIFISSNFIGLLFRADNYKIPAQTASPFPLYAIITMPIFGDEKTFGTKCFITDEPPVNGWIFIRCHLVLGSQFIGDPDETDALGVSAGHLKRLRDQVTGRYGNLTHPLFQSLTDVEIFELILKSNQLEEEFDPNFEYLPALEKERLFGRHHFFVGESTDAYFLVVIEQSEKLKFLWKNLRAKEVQSHSVECSREEVVFAIDSCLNYLKNAFPEQMSWLQL